MAKVPHMNVRWSGKGIPVPQVGQTVRWDMCLGDLGREGHSGRVYANESRHPGPGHTYINAFMVTGLVAVPVSTGPQEHADGSEGILAVLCSPIAASAIRDREYTFFGSELTEVYGEAD